METIAPEVPTQIAATVDLVVPVLGESVTEATVGKWFKQPGDAVETDEPVLELETEKVSLEVNAPSTGTLSEIVAAEGAEVTVGALLGRLAAGAGAVVAPAPIAAPNVSVTVAPSQKSEVPLSPAVRRVVEENDLDPSKITGTGKNGRITKEDALAAAASGTAHRDDPVMTQAPATPAPAAAPPPAPQQESAPAPAAAPQLDDPREERVRMTRLRKMVATRLKAAQNTAAMLTTWNEIDMTEAIALRNRYKDIFEKKHDIKLGFMSIFIKAVCVALKEWPAVNAEIRGDDIVYKNFYDISVAVGSPQGLVVPVIRDADTLNFDEIEKTIKDFGLRARGGTLKVEEMQGGTFTISNGGIFGSLLSAPILNPPQSGILGMHKMQMRPMVMADGSIEARPMMYIALSYDHRIIDGREAVSFLVRVKECIEDPNRIMLIA
ncbi:2-oxoglutarate dehydrogenase complex dihydrolipoyllysine-residue succinyltransferase [Magnetospira sp. QH-2]|uniref:2-oxoglutarate dehydrogenase complex dihydrolipoyllysine-residue succinyltransferase n=1 Tax=Magnetospira sp. (strain QH-2) TaxID=1288970 RepID=UPI0018E07D4A|nr:2-oxoglutarate dehydrogenase complex dihydrolipoyllysine-residue succinyltransferase [Magnetospira sp. QH-2]